MESTSAVAATEYKKRQIENDMTYMFEGIRIEIILDDDDILWFKVNDVANALDFKVAKQVLYDSIDVKFIKSYAKLRFDNISVPDNQDIHLKTMFVNEIGINLFVKRSRKPKADAFSDWICNTILPSFRQLDRYEVTNPKENRYKILNDLHEKLLKEKDLALKEKDSILKEKDSALKEALKEKDSALKEKDSILKEKDSALKEKDSALKEKDFIIKEKDSILKEKDSTINILATTISSRENQLSKTINKLFEIQPTCVPPLENNLKREYVMIIRTLTTDDVEFPYYVLRRQESSLSDAYDELRSKYPVVILKMSTPNSVHFFNLILEQMKNLIIRSRINMFHLRGKLTEKDFIRNIKNLYRTTYGIEVE